MEVAAALSRKERSGALSSDDAGVLLAAFEADWHDFPSPFVPVAVAEQVMEESAALSRRHGLRAYDAVQLASAVSARAAGVDVDVFLCFDDELGEAAAREGLPVAS